MPLTSLVLQFGGFNLFQPLIRAGKTIFTLIGEALYGLVIGLLDLMFFFVFQTPFPATGPEAKTPVFTSPTAVTGGAFDNAQLFFTMQSVAILILVIATIVAFTGKSLSALPFVKTDPNLGKVFWAFLLILFWFPILAVSSFGAYTLTGTVAGGFQYSDVSGGSTLDGTLDGEVDADDGGDGDAASDGWTGVIALILVATVGSGAALIILLFWLFRFVFIIMLGFGVPVFLAFRAFEGTGVPILPEIGDKLYKLYWQLLFLAVPAGLLLRFESAVAQATATALEAASFGGIVSALASTIVVVFLPLAALATPIWLLSQYSSAASMVLGQSQKAASKAPTKEGTAAAAGAYATSEKATRRARLREAADATESRALQSAGRANDLAYDTFKGITGADTQKPEEMARLREGRFGRDDGLSSTFQAANRVSSKLGIGSETADPEAIAARHADVTEEDIVRAGITATGGAAYRKKIREIQRKNRTDSDKERASRAIQADPEAAVRDMEGDERRLAEQMLGLSNEYGVEALSQTFMNDDDFGPAAFSDGDSERMAQVRTLLNDPDIEDEDDLMAALDSDLDEAYQTDNDKLRSDAYVQTRNAIMNSEGQTLDARAETIAQTIGGAERIIDAERHGQGSEEVNRAVSELEKLGEQAATSPEAVDSFVETAEEYRDKTKDRLTEAGEVTTESIRKYANAEGMTYKELGEVVENIDETFSGVESVLGSDYIDARDSRFVDELSGKAREEFMELTADRSTEQLLQDIHTNPSDLPETEALDIEELSKQVETFQMKRIAGMESVVNEKLDNPDTLTTGKELEKDEADRLREAVKKYGKQSGMQQRENADTLAGRMVGSPDDSGPMDYLDSLGQNIERVVNPVDYRPNTSYRRNRDDRKTGGSPTGGDIKVKYNDADRPAGSGDSNERPVRNDSARGGGSGAYNGPGIGDDGPAGEFSAGTRIDDERTVFTSREAAERDSRTRRAGQRPTSGPGGGFSSTGHRKRSDGSYVVEGTDDQGRKREISIRDTDDGTVADFDDGRSVTFEDASPREVARHLDKTNQNEGRGDY